MKQVSLAKNFSCLALLALACLVLGGCGGDPLADMSDQELIERGTAEINTFNFKESRRIFQYLRARSPIGSEAWEKATFGQALSAQHQVPPTASQMREAQGLLEELLEKAPDSPLAPRAWIMLGRIAELIDYPGDAVDLPTARTHYQQVTQRYGGQVIADEALLYLAGTYIQQFEDRQAMLQGVALLEARLAQGDDFYFAGPMWEYLGNTYLLALHDKERALACLLKADAAGLVNINEAGTTYWKMAELAEEITPPEVAVAVLYYQKIIIETPRSGRAYEAQQALRRLAQAHPGLNITIPALPSFGDEGGPVVEARP